MNWFIRCILFLLLSSSALAAEPISSWTGKPYAEILHTNPYGMRFGFDSNLSQRNLILFVDMFDWSKIQTDIQSESPDYWYHLVDLFTPDYISSFEVLEDIQKKDPEIYEQLAQGLSFEKPDILRPATQEVVQISGNSILNSPEGELHSMIKTVENESHGFQIFDISGNIVDRGKIKELGLNTKTGTIKKADLPTFVASDPKATANIADKTDSPILNLPDYKVFAGRFSALDRSVRARLISFPHLTAKSKTSVLLMKRYITDSKLLISGFPFSIKKFNRGILETYASNLGELKPNLNVTQDELNRKPKNKTNLNQKPENEAVWSSGLEWRFVEPMNDPIDFLQELHWFYKKANKTHFIMNPSQQQSPDGDFHIHISVDEDRKYDGIEDLVDLWEQTIALHQVTLGDLGWSGPIASEDEGYNSSGSNSVRVIDKYHAEIRFHIMSPEDTITQWAYLVSVPIEQARKHVFQNLLGEITIDHLMEMALKNPKMLQNLLRLPEFLQSLKFDPFQQINDRVLKYIIDTFEAKYETALKMAGFIDLHSYSPEVARLLSKENIVQLEKFILDKIADSPESAHEDLVNIIFRMELLKNADLRSVATDDWLTNYVATMVKTRLFTHIDLWENKSTSTMYDLLYNFDFLAELLQKYYLKVIHHYPINNTLDLLSKLGGEDSQNFTRNIKNLSDKEQESMLLHVSDLSGNFDIYRLRDALVKVIQFDLHGTESLVKKILDEQPQFISNILKFYGSESISVNSPKEALEQLKALTLDEEVKTEIDRPDNQCSDLVIENSP